MWGLRPERSAAESQEPTVPLGRAHQQATLGGDAQGLRPQFESTQVLMTCLALEIGPFAGLLTGVPTPHRRVTRPWKPTLLRDPCPREIKHVAMQSAKPVRSSCAHPRVREAEVAVAALGVTPAGLDADGVDERTRIEDRRRDVRTSA